MSEAAEAARLRTECDQGLGMIRRLRSDGSHAVNLAKEEAAQDASTAQIFKRHLDIVTNTAKLGVEEALVASECRYKDRIALEAMQPHIDQQSVKRRVFELQCELRVVEESPARAPGEIEMRPARAR